MLSLYIRCFAGKLCRMSGYTKSRTVLDLYPLFGSGVVNLDYQDSEPDYCRWAFYESNELWFLVKTSRAWLEWYISVFRLSSIQIGLLLWTVRFSTNAFLAVAECTLYLQRWKFYQGIKAVLKVNEIQTLLTMRFKHRCPSFSQLLMSGITISSLISQ